MQLTSSRRVDQTEIALVGRERGEAVGQRGLLPAGSLVIGAAGAFLAPFSHHIAGGRIPTSHQHAVTFVGGGPGGSVVPRH